MVTEESIKDFLKPELKDLDAAIMMVHYKDGLGRSYICGNYEPLCVLIYMLLDRIEKATGHNIKEQLNAISNIAAHQELYKVMGINYIKQGEDNQC